MKKWILVFSIALLPIFASAQCAMCKAVAETSQNAGSTASDGLNTGILYLMAFPYLLIGAVSIAIYRHKKQAKA